MSSPIDIGQATLEMEHPGLVAIRFKEGNVATPANFMASLEARRSHFGDQPHVALVIAPDDTDFDPSLLRIDQYKDSGADAFTLAMVFVCRNPTVLNIVEMYYARHPAPFPAQLFASEQEARAWVDAFMAERRR